MANPTELHERAMTIAKDLRTKYVELFQVLLEIETKKMYQQLEIVSLHAYCVQILELSENIANDFVQVVRKAITVPKLADAVVSKQVSISKARKICPVITEKSADEWIAVASENTCRVIEKTVATANPRAAVYETMRYVSGDTLEFRLAVSEDWEATLKETKDLLSQKYSRVVSSEEALLIVMKRFCETESPVRRAQRAQEAHRAQSAQQAQRTARNKERTEDKKSRDRETAYVGKVSTRAEAGPLEKPQAHPNHGPYARDMQASYIQARGSRARYRPARIEQIVDLRDQGQCVHVMPNGQRCTEKRWLQKHHIIEFACGGQHTPEKLETLCYVHHKSRHGRADRIDE